MVTSGCPALAPPVARFPQELSRACGWILGAAPLLSSCGRHSASDLGPSVHLAGSSVNGLEEPSIAKRLRGTPERIELENYRLSVRQAEELEEVPEETQAEHNLSSVLDKGTEEDVASR